MQNYWWLRSSKFIEILPNPRPHISEETKSSSAPQREWNRDPAHHERCWMKSEPWCQSSGVVALSGPSHAEEVARNLPTAVVSAHENETLHRSFRKFSRHRFRVYTNTDRLGVEAGAAFKMS